MCIRDRDSPIKLYIFEISMKFCVPIPPFSLHLHFSLLYPTRKIKLLDYSVCYHFYCSFIYVLWFLLFFHLCVIIFIVISSWALFWVFFVQPYLYLLHHSSFSIPIIDSYLSENPSWVLDINMGEDRECIHTFHQ